MAKDAATVLRITLGEEPIGQWCTTETYGQLILTCLSNHQAAYGSHDSPIECSLISDSFSVKLKDLFRREKKRRTSFLVVDFSSIASTTERYSYYCDYLCVDLQHGIERLPKASSGILDLLLIVSDLDEFLNSVTLRQLLEKSCVEKGVGLIVVQMMPTPRAEMVFRSERLDPDCTRKIASMRRPLEVPALTSVPIDEEIRQSIDQICGHFEIYSHLYHSENSKRTHVTSLISLDRCLQNSRVLPYVQSLLKEWAGHTDFVVATVGLQVADMDGLARGVVNNDASRFGLTCDLRDRKVAIVCDVIWGAYDLEAIAKWCVTHGAVDVLILGFSQYTGYHVPGVQTHCIVEVEGKEFAANDGTCPYCLHGDTAVKGEYLGEFLDDIKTFHPFIFWEMVSSTKGAYFDGHWESTVTSYHYLHRLWCEPLFRKHGYGIALRIRNLIAEKGILNEWIDTFLCPEEPQAIMLAEEINRALKGNPKTIIKIPREHFTSVTGTSISNKLQEYMVSVYGKDALHKRNVIIIDQAAHHFGTLSALSNICHLLGGRILAFVVAIDRLHPSTTVADWLPNSHYVALYKWPWPPFKADQCPCMHGRQHS